MQEDIHYYAILFLSKAAGFSVKDAHKIAHASQYVDDSTEGDSIRVGEAYFDPTRTAHMGLSGVTWSVQKKIYIPFHFLPARSQYTVPENLMTKQGSKNVYKLWNHILQLPPPYDRLIAMGIAIHTIADTWSHKNFSGRHDTYNDIESIEEWEQGEYTKSIWKNIVWDALPDVGHAEAGTLPDLPFLKWRYKTKIDNKEASINRNNSKDFLKGMEVLFGLLKRAVPKGRRKGSLKWKHIEDDIKEALEYEKSDLDKRCRNWRKLYKKVFPKAKIKKYDKYVWRKQALGSKNIDWDKKRRSFFDKIHFGLIKGFYKTDWVKFHKAALHQRNFVLENIL